MNNWIYFNNKNNSERYVLGQVVNNEKCLVCFGINPSTAIPYELDKTLTSVRNKSIIFNYKSWIMLNIYPQIATNPKKVDISINIDSHKKNLEKILYLKNNYKFDIWAAWGDLILSRNFYLQCLKDIYNILGKDYYWFTLGKITIKGNPHHPLYLKKNEQQSIFKIENYLKIKSKINDA